MSLAEEFDIRVMDPLLREAAARRAAAVLGCQKPHRRDMPRARRLALLRLMSDGVARSRCEVLAQLSPLLGDSEYAFYAARDRGDIAHTGAGRGRHLAWHITDSGRAVLAGEASS